MPTKQCCCKSNNCCDPIIYSNFIVLAGETMDDAAPVSPDDVIVLTLNRLKSGSVPETVYGKCPEGQSQLDCFCTNCTWACAHYPDYDPTAKNCAEVFPLCG